MLRRVLLAAPLLALAAAPALAQPATTAGDTFRVEGLQVLLPPGTPALEPSADSPGAYMVNDRAANRFITIAVRGPAVPGPAPTGDEMEAALKEASEGQMTTFLGWDSTAVITPEPPSSTDLLAIVGKRISGTTRGRPFAAWGRTYVARTGAERWATVIVLGLGVSDLAADEGVARMMESPTLDPLPLPAGEETTLADAGMTLRLPAGNPPLETRTGAMPVDAAYSSMNERNDLQVGVFVKAYPTPPGGAGVALRRQLLAALLPQVIRGGTRPDPIPDLPGHLTRSVLVRETADGEAIEGVVRGYVTRTGPVRLVIVAVRRLGTAPALDDPRVKELFDSIRFDAAR